MSTGLPPRIHAFVRTPSYQITSAVDRALLLSGHTRKYDWQHKLIVQLSPEELMLVLAVINGKLHIVQFTEHGARHDKLFEFTGRPVPI